MLGLASTLMVGLLTVAPTVVIAPETPCVDAQRLRARLVTLEANRPLSVRVGPHEGSVVVEASGAGIKPLRRIVPASAEACAGVERVVTTLVNAWLRTSVPALPAHVNAQPPRQVSSATPGPGTSHSSPSPAPAAGRPPGAGNASTPAVASTNDGASSRPPVSAATVPPSSTSPSSGPGSSKAPGVAAQPSSTGASAPSVSVEPSVALSASPGPDASDRRESSPRAVSGATPAPSGSTTAYSGLSASEDTAAPRPAPPLTAESSAPRTAVGPSGSENVSPRPDAAKAGASAQPSSSSAVPVAPTPSVSSTSPPAAGFESSPSAARARWSVSGGAALGAAIGPTPSVVAAGSFWVSGALGRFGVLLEGGLQSAQVRPLGGGEVWVAFQWLSLGPMVRFSPTDEWKLELFVAVRGTRFDAGATGFDQVRTESHVGVGGAVGGSIWRHLLGPLWAYARLTGSLRAPVERLSVTNVGSVDVGIAEAQGSLGLLLSWEKAP